jgi:hypothetical protein
VLSTSVSSDPGFRWMPDLESSMKAFILVTACAPRRGAIQRPTSRLTSQLRPSSELSKLAMPLPRSHAHMWEQWPIVTAAMVAERIAETPGSSTRK